MPEVVLSLGVIAGVAGAAGAGGVWLLLAHRKPNAPPAPSGKPVPVAGGTGRGCYCGFPGLRCPIEEHGEMEH